VQNGHLAGNIPTILRKLTPSEDKAHTAKIMAERDRERIIRSVGSGFARLHSDQVISVTWQGDTWYFDPGQSTTRFTTKVGERVFASKDEAMSAPSNRKFWSLV